MAVPREFSPTLTDTTGSNVSRFILQQAEAEEIPAESPTLADQWIRERLATVTANVNKKIIGFDYGSAGEELLKFTWGDVADWYLEIAKIEKGKQQFLQDLLRQLLKLWHPFAPFVTEQIWSEFNDSILMVQDYPLAEKPPSKKLSQTAEQFKIIQELITGLRNVRGEYRLNPIPVYASYLQIPEDMAWIANYAELIEKLTRTKLNFEPMDEDKKMPYFLWKGQKVFLIIPNFDAQKEIALTQKQLKDTEAFVKRISAQIKKPGFLKKAPADIVEKMKLDLADAETKAKNLKTKIKQLR